MKKTNKRTSRTDQKRVMLTSTDLAQVVGGISEIGFPACDGASKDAAKLVS